MSRRRAPGDAGSATVLVLGLAAVLCVVGTAASALAAVAVARHRAAAAADLAALAAAARVADGPDQACAAGRRAAEAAAAHIVRCDVAGREVAVIAAVRPPGPLGRLGAAAARARAGPVDLSVPLPDGSAARSLDVAALVSRDVDASRRPPPHALAGASP